MVNRYINSIGEVFEAVLWNGSNYEECMNFIRRNLKYPKLSMSEELFKSNFKTDQYLLFPYGEFKCIDKETFEKEYRQFKRTTT